MKTKLQYWEQNSELELFVKMAALPLAFLGLLLILSLTLFNYSEATQPTELPAIAYQNP
ncbi:hypothetical protein ACN4EK_07050 [Pantanalinema rosaneae CENA516]|uniref:hypothetical protein n=1 Tax=Pantanalinema rosaneae TaxID=1620701 RepID=UPI003D6F1DEC